MNVRTILAAFVLCCLSQSGFANTNAVDAFFSFQYLKTGTAPSSSFTISLGSEVIFNNVVVSAPSTQNDIQYKGVFTRPLIPGVKYKLQYVQGTNLGMETILSLPEGFKAEVDGILSSTVAIPKSAGAGTFPKTLIIRNQDIMEGGGETPLGEATELQVGDLYWKVGLGRLPGGRSAGYLAFSAENINASIVSRTSLAVLLGAFSSSEVVVGYEDKNLDGLAETPTFVKTPQAFVELTDLAGGSTGFDVLFWSEGVESTAGVYVPASGSTPLVRYRFLLPATNTLQVTQSEWINGVESSPRKTSTATNGGPGNWNLAINGGNLGVSTIVSTTTPPSGLKERTRSISYSAQPSNLPADAATTFSVKEVYKDIPLPATGGVATKLVEQRFNAGSGNERIQQYAYWEDANDSSRCGLMRSAVSSFGEWHYYDYTTVNGSRFYSPLESLAGSLTSANFGQYHFALEAFSRKVGASVASADDTFAFTGVPNWGTSGNGSVLYTVHEYGITWDEGDPREIAKSGQYLWGSSNSAAYTGLRDLDPVAFPTIYNLGTSDIYQDFVCVTRRRLHRDASEFVPGAPDMAGLEMQAVYVPSKLDNQFDQRKAFKPAYTLGADGTKSVFGYSPITGYSGTTGATWAEIEVTGTGAPRLAYEYKMTIPVNSPNGGTGSIGPYSTQLISRLVDVSSNPGQMRRQLYFGADAAPGTSDPEPYGDLWSPSQILHSGITFNNTDAISTISGKSKKSVRIFNDPGDLILMETYVLDTAGSWQLVEKIRSVYDNYGRLTNAYLSKPGGSERSIFSSIYDGLRKQSETDGAGVTTNYTYDGLGRVATIASSSPHNNPDLPAQLVKSLAYDAMGRVVEEVREGGAAGRIKETQIYDSQGLVVKIIDQARLPTTLSYTIEPGAGRKVTTTYPDGSNYIQIYSKDGKIKQEQGSAITTKYYSYQYDGANNGAPSAGGKAGPGVMIARVDEGYPRNSSNPHSWAEEIKDMSDRVIRQITAAQGAPFVKEFVYDTSRNRLNHTLETRIVPGAGTGSTTLRTNFQYDAAGILVATGTDFDGAPDQLEPSGKDRYSSYKFNFVTVSGPPYLEAGTYAEETFTVRPLNSTDPAQAGSIAVDRVVMLQPAALLIEFSTLPGTLYQIQYSEDGKAWTGSPLRIRAGGNRLQWIDRGPPGTISPPIPGTARFYRVKQLPGS